MEINQKVSMLYGEGCTHGVRLIFGQESVTLNPEKSNKWFGRILIEAHEKGINDTRNVP